VELHSPLQYPLVLIPFLFRQNQCGKILEAKCRYECRVMAVVVDVNGRFFLTAQDGLGSGLNTKEQIQVVLRRMPTGSRFGNGLIENIPGTQPIQVWDELRGFLLVSEQSLLLKIQRNLSRTDGSGQ